MALSSARETFPAPSWPGIKQIPLPASTAQEPCLCKQVREEPEGSAQEDPGDGCDECADDEDDGDEDKQGHAEVDDGQLDGLGC